MAKSLMLTLLLAGCSASSGTFCDIARIHNFPPELVDLMPPDIVAREEAHNEIVDDCG